MEKTPLTLFESFRVLCKWLCQKPLLNQRSTQRSTFCLMSFSCSWQVGIITYSMLHSEWKPHKIQERKVAYVLQSYTSWWLLLLLILMACQIVQGYSLPRGQGIVYIYIYERVGERFVRVYSCYIIVCIYPHSRKWLIIYVHENDYYKQLYINLHMYSLARKKKNEREREREWPQKITYFWVVT